MASIKRRVILASIILLSACGPQDAPVKLLQATALNGVSVPLCLGTDVTPETIGYQDFSTLPDLTYATFKSLELDYFEAEARNVKSIVLSNKSSRKDTQVIDDDWFKNECEINIPEHDGVFVLAPVVDPRKTKSMNYEIYFKNGEAVYIDGFMDIYQD